MPSRTARPFSTTTQVYPAYLPTLHKSGRMEKRLATATIAAAGIGYGLARYKQVQAHRQEAERQSQSAARANEAVMSAFGDRSSLAELEAAVQTYDQQRS